jgi:hypothetical protein
MIVMGQNVASDLAGRQLVIFSKIKGGIVFERQEFSFAGATVQSGVEIIPFGWAQ